MTPSRNLARLAVVAVGVTAAALVTPATAQAVPTARTCHRGSIPAGTYSSLTVTGLCNLNRGNVTVTGDVTLEAHSGLNAAFGGSNLTVGHDLIVGSGAILVLGCEPEAFICFNDPDQNVGTLVTHDRIADNLIANGALMMLIHHNRIGRNVIQTAGGGGNTCSNFPLGPDGPPAYSTYEDNRIGNNAAVMGVTTCWLGFIRNHVADNVNYIRNVTNDPDGNEVVSNTIAGNLNCFGNNPKPQVGDSGGAPNAVGGQKNGQCAHIH